MSALPPKADIEMARIIFGVVAPAASPHCSQYYLFEWFEQKRTRFGAANDSNCLEKFGGRTRTRNSSSNSSAHGSKSRGTSTSSYALGTASSVNWKPVCSLMAVHFAHKSCLDCLCSDGGR